MTGDLKFHTALDSEIVVYDICHFESEIIALPVLKNLIGDEVEIIYADEKSPFAQIQFISTTLTPSPPSESSPGRNFAT